MIYLLHGNLSTSDSGSYLPIAIQVIFAVGLIVFLIVVTHLLGPKRKTADKLQTFASGIESHGDARQPHPNTGPGSRGGRILYPAQISRGWYPIASSSVP